jgi:hypothetical protein
MSIRDALKSFLGQNNMSAEQAQQELFELRIQASVEKLTSEGYLSADPQTQELARRFATSDPAGFELLMRRPRTTPAQPLDPNAQATQGQVVDPTPKDGVEAAIAKLMAEKNLPYHEAAIEVSRGGALTNQPTGGNI